MTPPPKMIEIHTRFDPATIAAVDAHVDRMNAYPGVRMSRSAVIRMMVDYAIAHEAEIARVVHAGGAEGIAAMRRSFATKAVLTDPVIGLPTEDVPEGETDAGGPVVW